MNEITDDIRYDHTPQEWRTNRPAELLTCGRYESIVWMRLRTPSHL